MCSWANVPWGRPEANVTIENDMKKLQAGNEADRNLTTYS